MQFICPDKLKGRASARATRSGPVRQDMSLLQLLKVKGEMEWRLDHLTVDKIDVRYLW